MSDCRVAELQARHSDPAPRVDNVRIAVRENKTRFPCQISSLTGNINMETRDTCQPRRKWSGKQETREKEKKMDTANEEVVSMIESALQNAPDGFREKLVDSHNDYLTTKFTFQNIMLNVVMVFLGLSIPMFCALNFKGLISACMGVGIVSGMVAAGMLITAEYKLMRQKGESVNKMIASLLQKMKLHGLFDGSIRGYEEVCNKYWIWPFLVMALSCVLAVIIATMNSVMKSGC